MQTQLLNENWDLLKLFYYAKAFYPDFDPDKTILEQSLIMTSDKSLLYMLYLKKLLDSIDGVVVSTYDIELSEPSISFALTSIPGEYAYELINSNVDDISDEIEDCCLWDEAAEPDGDMCFYVPLYEDTCPETFNIIESVFDKELFTALDGYVGVELCKDVEVIIYISVNINNLIPDKINEMIPLEEYIKFRD